MSTDANTSRRAFFGAVATGVAGVAVGGVTGSAVATANPRPRRADIALTHATVIDTSGARSRPDMTVLLAGTGSCAGPQRRGPRPL